MKKNFEKKEENQSKSLNFKEFIKKVKSIKHIELIMAILFIVIALLLYFTITDKTSNINAKDKQTCELISLDEQIQDILKSIDGVGNNRVLITYRGSEKIVIAMEEETVSTSTTDTETNGNRIKSESTTNKTPIMVSIDGVMQPVVLETIRAEIEGVVIVAEGGNDIKTKMTIIDAVSSLLDIESSKIKIFKMNNQ